MGVRVFVLALAVATFFYPVEAAYPAEAVFSSDANEGEVAGEATERPLLLRLQPAAVYGVAEPKRRVVWVPWLRTMLDSFSVGGVLYDDYQTPMSSNKIDLASNTLGVNLKFSTRSYIWRPWFSTLDLGIGVSSSRIDSSAGDVGASYLIGDLGLSIFPLSRFPFRAVYGNNRDEFDTDVFGSVVNSEIITLKQLYRTMDNTNYLLSYERRNVQTDSRFAMDAEDTGSFLEVSDRLNFDVSGNFENHSVSVNSELYEVKQITRSDGVTTTNLVTRDRYAPAQHFFVDSMVNYNETSYLFSQGAQDSLSFSKSGWTVAQLSSYAAWRPEDSPWVVNASARVSRNTNSSENFTQDGVVTQKSEDTITVGNMLTGVTYRASKNLRTTASLDVNKSLDIEEDDATYGQRLETSYNSDYLNLGVSRYNWNASTTLSNDFTTVGNTASFTPIMGHYLNCSVYKGSASTVTLNLGQTYSATQFLSSAEDTKYSAGEDEQTLTDNASVTWLAKGKKRYARIRLSGSNARTGTAYRDFGGYNSQFVRFDALFNWRIGSYSSISGDYSVRFTNQEIADDGLPGDNDTKSNGKISYRNRRALGVRGLGFLSEVRVTDETVFPTLGQEEKDREEFYWENRFEYYAGKLKVASSVQFAQISGQMRGLVFLRLIREFGNR